MYHGIDLIGTRVDSAIFYLLASQWIEINAWSMLSSILQVVLFPDYFRAGDTRRAETESRKLYFGDALNFVVAIVLIVAAIIGGSKAQILESGLLILAVVALHNAIGYLLGFAAARMFPLPHADCKKRSRLRSVCKTQD